MSDPFQYREQTHKITYQILELSNKYNYPVIISTKAGIDEIPNEYFDILNPDIHAFQISLISTNDEFVKVYENNTPSATNRIKLIKKLKDMGFWCSIRIQPLIDINEAKNIVLKLSNIVDYITVEHIKIASDNSDKEYMFELCNANPKDFVHSGREYEVNTNLKLKHINELKEISKCPIGCGDNDLHEYSDSLNCCGIDVINNNFDNWWKYNSMYINMTNDVTQWVAQSKCHNCFNSTCQHKEFSAKDYVDWYMKYPPKLGKCKLKLERLEHE